MQIMIIKGPVMLSLPAIGLQISKFISYGRLPLEKAGCELCKKCLF